MNECNTPGGAERHRDISVNAFLFVRLRISPVRIKPAASNFVRRFMGARGRESPILGNFQSINQSINQFISHHSTEARGTVRLCRIKEAQNRTNRPPTRGSKFQGGKSFRNCVPINIARRVCNEVHLNYVKCIIVYTHITLALYRLD